MPNLMIENKYRELDGKPPMMLVDLGYIKNQLTCEHADALRAFGIGRRNFSVEGYGRLLVKIPIRKAAAVLAAFPIVEDGRYWQTTHHWPWNDKDDE